MPPSVTPSSVGVEDAADAFTRAAVDAFVLEDVWGRRLEHHPWPRARYLVLVARSARVGRWSLRYEFDRVRGGASGADHVSREVTLDVLPAGTHRTLLLSHPHRFPIAVGDSIELPVPLDDPWGTIGSARWSVEPLDPAPGPAFVPEPCHGHASLPPLPVVPSALQRIGVGCVQRLLANLQGRTQIWIHYAARSPGPVPELAVEVIDGEGPVVSPLKQWVERITNGSSSTTLQLDRRAVVPLRTGDELWTLGGEASSPSR